MNSMKRRIGLLVAVVLLCLSVFAIASCGAPEIEAISFSNKQETYDGTEKSIEVAGLPAGATVTYSPANTYKDAGTYTVTATVKQEGFADTTLTATLTIDPKVVTVTYGDLVFKANGEAPKKVDYTVNGLVEGDSVELEFDFGECDFYEEDYEGTFTAKSKNPNYTLKASSQSKKFTVGPNEHTVKFETGVVNQTLDDQTVADATKIRAPRKIINTGYEFIGWFNGEELWDFEKGRVTDDMTLVAKWKPNEYKISYQLNGGTNAPGNPDKYVFDQGAVLHIPTKPGYMFLGWFTDAECTAPAKEIAPSTLALNLTLYAKWSTEKYSTIIADKTLAGENLAIIGDKCAINGDFKYTFVANVTEFGDDGVIYIGRGKDTLEGTYLEITGEYVIVHTNGESNEIVSDERVHGRNITGYISVDIAVSGGKAIVTIHTADGSSTINNLSWAGRNGEIFASCANAELANASFAWYTNAYEQPVWMVGDANVGLGEDHTWTNTLARYGYGDFLSIGSNGLDSAAALEVFKTALANNVPKYAIWSFVNESGADYEANLASFLKVCEDNNIIPVLTTHSVDINAANEAKNAAVKSSGKRYIDFAEAAKAERLF